MTKKISEMIKEFHTTFKVEPLEMREQSANKEAAYLQGAAGQLTEEVQELMGAISRYIKLRDLEDNAILDMHYQGKHDPDLSDFDAPIKKTRVQTLDALADIVYVAYNLADKLSLDLETAVERVHTSNMTKLDDNGEPLFWEEGNQYGQPAGKVRKSDNYQPPELEDLVGMDDVEIPKPKDPSPEQVAEALGVPVEELDMENVLPMK